MQVGVLCACVYVCQRATGTQRGQEKAGIRIPGAGVIEGCERP